MRRFLCTFILYAPSLGAARTPRYTSAIPSPSPSTSSPSPSTSTICLDEPIGWKAGSTTCEDMKNENGEGCSILANFLVSNGVFAKDACCVCGGGMDIDRDLVPTKAPRFVTETPRREREREALKLLYGPIPTAWEGLDHCDWEPRAHGMYIRCDEEGHVTNIKFSKPRYDVPFPSEVGVLQILRELRLDSTRFEGFATELCALPELETLSLRANSLGSIPTEIGNLRRLRFLDLSFTSLEGTIPSQIGFLKELKVFRAQNIRVELLPIEIGMLRNLEILELPFHHISHIPTQIGLLESLRRLELSNGKITGSLPTEIGMLLNLERFSINDNSLTGTLPTELGMLAQAEVLNFDNNNIAGSIPQEIFQLKSLMVFSATYNALVGTIPSEINALNMTRLYLGSNNIEGSIPTQVQNLKRLEVMMLHINMLTGTLPTQLGRLDKLTELRLYRNSLQGTLPAQLGKMTNLNSIMLGNNRLYGSIPSEISNLRLLEELSLENNLLDRSLPEHICLLTSLTNLNIQNNQITGHIPNCIGNVTALRYLVLASNRLGGPLPDGLWDLDLYELDLRANSLSGNISTSISQFTNLDKLDLSNNMLNGTLPSEIGQLQWIKLIDLSQNGLSGGIPTEIGNLWDLKHMDLSRNDLSSSIPSEFKSLTQLDTLLLQENKLNSDLPFKFPWSLSVSKLNISNNELTGILGNEYVTPETDSLIELDMSHNQFSGGIPLFLSALTNLQTLNLGWNQLSREVELNFEAMGKLIVLDLSHNLLAGSIPESIDSLVRLQALRLQSNKFQGQLLPGLGRLMQLREIDISNNRFVTKVYRNDWVVEMRGIEGSLPIEWGQLAVTERLDVSGNLLTGVVPESFANLERVRFLHLHDNTLTGQVPYKLGDLENLEELTLTKNNWEPGSTFPLRICSLADRTDVTYDNVACPPERNILQIFFDAMNGNDWAVKEGWLHEYRSPCDAPEWHGLSCNNHSSSVTGIKLPRNGLFGTLPGDIFMLEQLETLDLADNTVFGTLPTKVGMSMNLKMLNVAGNQLSGTLPRTYTNIPSMKQLQMHENQFTGTISDFNGIDITADCGDPYFQGELVCDECTMCCNSLGECNPKADTSEYIFENNMFIIWATPFLFTCLAAASVMTLTFLVKGGSEGFVDQLCGNESIYVFVLVRGYFAPLVALGIVSLQIAIFSIFLDASRSDYESSDVEYTWRCPVAQPWCEDNKEVTPFGLFVFMAVMVLGSVNDMINGAKLFNVAFRVRSARCFAGGFFLTLVSFMGMWTSFKYNRATATKNTELIANSVILLFVEDVDEWAFSFFKNVMPSLMKPWLRDAGAFSESIMEEVNPGLRTSKKVSMRDFFGMHQFDDNQYDDPKQTTNPSPTEHKKTWRDNVDQEEEDYNEASKAKRMEKSHDLVTEGSSFLVGISAEPIDEPPLNVNKGSGGHQPQKTIEEREKDEHRSDDDEKTGADRNDVNNVGKKKQDDNDDDIHGGPKKSGTAEQRDVQSDAKPRAQRQGGGDPRTGTETTDEWGDNLDVI